MTRKLVRKALDDLKVSESAFSKVLRYLGDIPENECSKLISYYRPPVASKAVGAEPEAMSLEPFEVAVEAPEEDRTTE